MQKASVILKPSPPYDFELTCGFATHPRGRYGGDIYEDGEFRRLLDVAGQPCLARVRSCGTVDEPCLEAEFAAPELHDSAVVEAQRQIAWILSLQQDVSGFYRMAREDTVLASLVETMRGLHIPHTATVYEGLILAILGQQISSHVARALRSLLISKYGPSLEVEGTIYHGFPRPASLAAATPEELRALGFSGRKSGYIREISQQVESGRLDLEGLRARPDEEIGQTLMALRGVGLWTAHWLFVRAFGRDDGFPHGDLALCRVMGQLFNGGTAFAPEQALEYSRRWVPFRSFVTAYLFAAMRSGYGSLSV